METWMWIVLIVVVAIVAAAVAYMIATRQRSAKLKKRFGPEYDRTVESAGDRSEAERELRDRADRRDKIDIVPLSTEDRRRYSAEWEDIQRRFVDQPESAVASADDLIVTVMEARGYPVSDFHERTDMVSADHPDVVNHYRRANSIRSRGSAATTEELRAAFVHYRALFDEMLADENNNAGRDSGRTTRNDRGESRDSSTR